MPDDLPRDLYNRDILAWAETQAGLLRRLAAGERVNDAVDWPNLIEETEAVGRSELRACESLLVQVMLHLLKLHRWPAGTATAHWHAETVGFLADARRAYAPSMRQRIDLGDLYADALRRAGAAVDASGPGCQLPPTCPFTLDDLLAAVPSVAALTARLAH